MTIGLRSTNRSDLSYSTRGDDIPTGEVILFYADTAPIGYTLKAGMNDKAVFVTSGSGNGGQTGGGAHSTGTWTQPSHQLTISEMPTHSHYFKTNSGDSNSTFVYPSYGDTSTDKNFHSATNTNMSNVIADAGGNGTHNHGTTWRPASYCFIACERS